jgi:phosphoglycolate phosphatase-like HAD superfamily hydrolase
VSRAADSQRPDEPGEHRRGAAEQLQELYEQVEDAAARASEHLVGTEGFARLLGQLAENAAALTKLTNDGIDLMLRNLRIAGRRDVVRLARQLGRTEDKLERLLQEVEAVGAKLDRIAGEREAHRPRTPKE